MIFGLETHPLPEDWTPLEAVAIVKCLSETGDVVLYQASTANLTPWESVGMLTSALDADRKLMGACFVADPDDDEDA